MQGAGRRIAIMQPYFFPYIGYYQLVRSVDTFVFYDDVNYIKGGWINRNRIAIGGKPAYITVPLEGASPNRLIRDIAVSADRGKLMRTIQQVYGKAPCFPQVSVLVADVLNSPVRSIGDLAMRSVTSVMDYLGVECDHRVSGDDFQDTKGLPRSERLIAIAERSGASVYINAIGGRELYRKEEFAERGIQMFFLEARLPVYRQFGAEFVPGLSMLDVLMFNTPEAVRYMLDDYRLL